MDNIVRFDRANIWINIKFPRLLWKAVNSTIGIYFKIQAQLKEGKKILLFVLRRTIDIDDETSASPPQQSHRRSTPSAMAIKIKQAIYKIIIIFCFESSGPDLDNQWKS